MSQGPTRVGAPAKINLGLRILGRRRDGYHELESLFLPLDLADQITLTLSPAKAIEVVLEVEGNAPAGADNLAARAAREYLEAARELLRVEIRLEKLTPTAAGLGGGSSDAAAVLRALTRQLPETVPRKTLVDLALALGADVPFFLDPRPSRVSGIGEQVDPLPGIPSLHLVLANPGAPVPTAEVYRAYDALHPTPPPPDSDAELFSVPSGAGLRELAKHVHNDLEAPAVRLCPAIARVRRQLEATSPVAVGLSGSGATLYALYEDRADAERASDTLRLPSPGWKRVAATLESR